MLYLPTKEGLRTVKGIYFSNGKFYFQLKPSVFIQGEEKIEVSIQTSRQQKELILYANSLAFNAVVQRGTNGRLRLKRLRAEEALPPALRDLEAAPEKVKEKRKVGFQYNPEETY